MITNMGVIDGVFRFVLGMGLLAWSYHRVGPELPEALAWAVWIVGAFLGLDRALPLLSGLRSARYR